MRPPDTPGTPNDPDTPDTPEAGPNQRPTIDITDTEWDLIGQRLGVPPRQVDIVRAYVRGHRKPEEIARWLRLETTSVKTHMQRLFKNIGVHDRTDVVIVACREVLKLRAAQNPS